MNFVTLAFLGIGGFLLFRMLGAPSLSNDDLELIGFTREEFATLEQFERDALRVEAATVRRENAVFAAEVERFALEEAGLDPIFNVA